MKNIPLSSAVKEILKIDIKKHIQSWEPVVRSNWHIEFSIYRNTICMVFNSIITGQTIVRFYTNEDEAVEYINFILSQDASRELLDT